MVFVYRYSRETSLFTDNLEFYLKQRTVSHNQDKAKLAIYKTKYEKLEREMEQLKNRENDQLTKFSKNQEQESEQIEGLKKEVAELKEQNQSLLAEKQTLIVENQDFRGKLESEAVKFSGLLKANQGLQERLDTLKGQIRLVESQKETVEAKLKSFAQDTKVNVTMARQPQESFNTSTRLTQDEQEELQELRMRDQVAQRIETLLKEKAQKDYNDILSLEKEIIHMRLKFEGQSHAFASQVQSYSQNAKPSTEVYNFGKQDLYQVKNEVTEIRSVVLNDIKPQMNQYMHELQGLAQKLRETRQSFFDNQLSRRAFESLNVEDVA